MSHELRTPLNHVLGFTQLLADRSLGPLNDAQRESLGDVLSSGKHLLALINDMLDLSRVETGTLALHLSTVRLLPLFERCMGMVREGARLRGIDLELDLDGAPETAVVDEQRFTQVMLNLLSNGLKFTPEGGRVCVAARRIRGDGGTAEAGA